MKLLKQYSTYVKEDQKRLREAKSMYDASQDKELLKTISLIEESISIDRRFRDLLYKYKSIKPSTQDREK